MKTCKVSLGDRHVDSKDFFVLVKLFRTRSMALGNRCGSKQYVAFAIIPEETVPSIVQGYSVVGKMY
jgi:hypothetical protein